MGRCPVEINHHCVDGGFPLAAFCSVKKRLAGELLWINRPRDWSGLSLFEERQNQLGILDVTEPVRTHADESLKFPAVLWAGVEINFAFQFRHWNAELRVQKYHSPHLETNRESFIRPNSALVITRAHDLKRSDPAHYAGEIFFADSPP